VTSPVDDLEALRRTLADAEALFLDFDGPVCSVFGGFPAPVVAEQLRDVLIQGGYVIPNEVRESGDPFDVLRYSAKLGPGEARHTEAALRAYEVEAVQVALPTPGAHELIRRWKATGRPLVIVSNNSAVAVEVYVARFQLNELIDGVSARVEPDPSLLKPAPHLINSAVQGLGIAPARTVLLGDSVADIEAAQAAGARSIGYVNRPDKRAMFVAVEADTITDSMVSLVTLV
jgi:phosphoglycolate phosphatase